MQQVDAQSTTKHSYSCNHPEQMVVAEYYINHSHQMQLDNVRTSAKLNHSKGNHSKATKRHHAKTF
jgi:hypothetical protein